MPAGSKSQDKVANEISADLRALAVPVDRLDALPGNPRRGDVEAVARSYAAFGQRKPIVARRVGDRGVVIAGNHQLAAVRQLGWSHVAVVWVDDDDETAAAFALADNRTADLGDYDSGLLVDMISQVNDEALLAATGYTAADVEELLAVTEVLPPAAVLADPDLVPDKVPAKTVPGDVWLLGPHRLMCGDSTSHTAVDELMAGAAADMVWTDPPYGVAYVGKTADALTIANDDLTLDNLEQFLRDALGNAATVSKAGAAWFVAAPAGPLFLAFAKVLHEQDIWRQTLVWLKSAFVMGRSDYHYRHEAIFYGWKPGAAHTPPPDRKQDTIWAFDKPSRNAEHPTMKPVELIAHAITNHTKPNQLVLDPFGGSGSTMLAAHTTGRIAHLMELDPHYCDVICTRYQQVTGIVPIAAATGNPHDFSLEA